MQSISNVVLIFGGCHDREILSDLYVYFPSETVFSKVEYMSPPINLYNFSYTVSVANNKMIYLYGGNQPQNERSIRSYNDDVYVMRYTNKRSVSIEKIVSVKDKPVGRNSSSIVLK